jgi:hypothetical protein
MWRLVTAMLKEKTSARIVFLGNDKQQWRDEISKVLTFDQFPKRFGGDGDDNSKVLMNYWVVVLYGVLICLADK